VSVRVGHIGFLNCYPLYHGLDRRGTLSRGRVGESQGATEFALIPGVPTELNRMLVKGDIDIAPISSIAYARNHRQLLLSRYLSISSFGAVDSIQLVTHRPWERIESVALTTQSATSVALLKTILKLRFGREVTYSDLQGTPAEGLTRFDAVLVIGDQGLDALYFPKPDATLYDLGEVWQEWTGLPMVYAVWAAREDFARAHGADLLAVEDELVTCMDYGRENHAEVVEGAAGRSRLDRKMLSRYFAILRYDFPPLYRDGLRCFYELAHEAGELDEVPEFRFIDEVAGRGRGPGAGGVTEVSA
jgi:chorismate dehydratase